MSGALSRGVAPAETRARGACLPAAGSAPSAIGRPVASSETVPATCVASSALASSLRRLLDLSCSLCSACSGFYQLLTTTSAELCQIRDTLTPPGLCEGLYQPALPADHLRVRCGSPITARGLSLNPGVAPQTGASSRFLGAFAPCGPVYIALASRRSRARSHRRV